MRRIVRARLSRREERFLHRKQVEVDDQGDPRSVWSGARKSRVMGRIAETLAAMTGRRRRCMYCEDSRGTDIDHFWPMSRYPQKTFLWPNLLWLCGGCNRKKGNRFETDRQGRPLLIDPTAEDPWDFLFFDADTGMIVARVDPATGAPHPKGEHVTDPRVLPVNIEPVLEGRRRTLRCLSRAVLRFMSSVQVAGDPQQAAAELLAEIRDHDEFGLVNWCFLRDGSEYPPFCALRQSHAAVWQRVADEIATGP